MSDLRIEVAHRTVTDAGGGFGNSPSRINLQVYKNSILQILRCHSSPTGLNLLNHPHHGIINRSGDPMPSTLVAEIAVEIIDFRLAAPLKGLKTR